MKKKIKFITVCIIAVFFANSAAFASREQVLLSKDKLSPQLMLSSPALETAAAVFLFECSKTYTFQDIAFPHASKEKITLQTVLDLNALLRKSYEEENGDACFLILKEMLQRGIIIEENDPRLVLGLSFLKGRKIALLFPYIILSLEEQKIIDIDRAEELWDEFFEDYLFELMAVDFYIDLWVKDKINKEKLLEKASGIISSLNTGYAVETFIDIIIKLHEKKFFDRRSAQKQILLKIGGVRSVSDENRIISFLRCLFKVRQAGIFDDNGAADILREYLNKCWNEVHYQGEDEEKMERAFILNVGFEESLEEKLLLALKDLRGRPLLEKAMEMLRKNKKTDDVFVRQSVVENMFAAYDKREKNRKETIDGLTAILEISRDDFEKSLNIYLGMYDRGLMEKDKAAQCCLDLLAQSENYGFAFTYNFVPYYHDLLRKGLLYKKDHFYVLRRVMERLIKEKRYSEYMQLYCILLETENIVLDRHFIDGRMQRLKDKGRKALYYFKLEWLMVEDVIEQKEYLQMKKGAEELFAKINAANEGADREAKKVDENLFYGFYAQGMAALQAVSSALAKELVCNRCQRGYLPLLVQDMDSCARLSAGHIKNLKAFYARRSAEGNCPLPGLMLPLINFANVFNSLGMPVKEFSLILKNGNKDEDIIFELGQRVIKELADKFGVDVDLSERDNVLDTLSQWNLKYLGSMVSASRRWDDEDRLMFRLVVKTALEGKFQAVLFPQRHARDIFENYSDEENDLIAQIRKFNANFLNIAGELGVNIELFAHPETFPAKLTSGKVLFRDWQVILRDFSENYWAFKQWLELSEYIDKPVISSRWIKVEKQLGVFNKLITEGIGSLGVFERKDQIKRSLLKFLSDFQEINFKSVDIPPQLHDLRKSVEEIMGFNYEEYRKQNKPLRMRFWRREVGRDSVVANEVDSCTGLDSNGRAVFEYLLDLGTVYLILDDPDTGEEKGYVRFFLKATGSGKPGIFIDSADGAANKESWQPVDDAREYIDEFAKSCNIDPENVNGIYGEKVGGALTECYYTNSKNKIEKFEPDRFQDERKLQIFEYLEVLSLLRQSI
ncbi:MAG: hypothetical protein KKD05_07120 [Candidatus Omnitrophica bacterium]|nr:hypothetical protein [Candidatus Omnitrophota bacterium]